MSKDIWISVKEWWVSVPQRWWDMLGVPITVIPLSVGVVAFAIWARHISPPLPWWNITLVIVGVILFILTSFFAFHRVRQERDEARVALGSRNKRQYIIYKLTEFYEAGVKFRQKLIKKELGDKSVEKHKDWIIPVIEFFRSNPNELGEPRLAYIAFPNYRETDIPNFAQLDTNAYAVHLLIETQLVKLMELIRELQQ